MAEVSVNNGVNIDALLAAREALKGAPEAAKFTWREVPLQGGHEPAARHHARILVRQAESGALPVTHGVHTGPSGYRQADPGDEKEYEPRAFGTRP